MDDPSFDPPRTRITRDSAERLSALLKDEQTRAARAEERLEKSLAERRDLLSRIDAAGVTATADPAGADSEQMAAQLRDEAARRESAEQRVRELERQRKRLLERLDSVIPATSYDDAVPRAPEPRETAVAPAAPVVAGPDRRPPTPTPPTVAPRRWLAPLGAAAVLALAVMAAFAGALLAGGPEEARQPAAERPGAAEPAAAPPPAVPRPEQRPPACSDLRAGALTRPVTCSSRTGKLLTIASEDQPVLLPGLEARVVEAAAVPGGVAVRLRLRSTTERLTMLDARSEQLYLSVGGTRVGGTVDGSRPVRLEPSRGVEVMVTFELSPEVAAALRRAGDRADLGITLPANVAKATFPEQRGVVRLDFAE